MNETKPAASRFVERTLAKLSAAWRGIASEAPDAAAGAAHERWAERIRACLEGPGGEISARARTAALGHEYLRLPPEQREAFLRVLAEEFDAPSDPIVAAAEAYRAAGDSLERRSAGLRLARSLGSPRLALLRRFTALPQGVKFLVDLRATLLGLAARDPVFTGLLEELSSLLRAWFDVGFLELRRITWDSPASLLEKLIAYEAVHEIDGWEDLKNRLDSDRRCFAFFHPRMPDEPLIFVEVALTEGQATAIQPLLDPAAPRTDFRRADTATFYSISNAQAGLVGISLGDFLIKQVVERLAGEFPQLKRFITLSPLPGFAVWLKGQRSADLLTLAERRLLPRRDGDDQHPLALIRNPTWHRIPTLAGGLETPLLRLAARYLLNVKRANGRAADAVAHFHLTNGARVERLNWLADVSPKGLAQSCGIMANYLYRMPVIETNHGLYTEQGKVPASSAIKALARG